MTDELNADAKRLVSLARQARTPGAADKRRIAERLAVPLAAGAAVGTAASTAKAVGVKALLGGLGVKVAAAVVVTAALATAVLTQLPQRPATAPVPSPPSSLVRAPAPVESPAPVVSAAPEPLASAAPSSKRAAAPSVRSNASTAHELEEEAALLHQAQAAWRAGQSAVALELANEHAQRFPRSQLSNERDVLRVLSLCKLGQVDSAKRVGARLLRSAKGSPWYQSVADSCAGQ
jgi:hypothetical protein